MKTITRPNRSAINLKTSQFISMICHERAIDCGYAALASAIEGKAWERNRYLNLMRRLAGLERRLHRADHKA
jgi:hypothetical protein